MYDEGAGGTGNFGCNSKEIEMAAINKKGCRTDGLHHVRQSFKMVRRYSYALQRVIWTSFVKTSV